MQRRIKEMLRGHVAPADVVPRGVTGAGGLPDRAGSEAQQVG